MATLSELQATIRGIIRDDSIESNQTELMPNQVDRDFSGASAWADVDLNAYNETGDLTITATVADQYCTLVVASAPTTVDRRYRMKFDVANIVSTWTIKSFDGTQTIGTVSANGTGQVLEWTATTTGGYRIVAASTTSSGDFDNFSLIETNLIYRINNAVSVIAGGIIMPDGQVSPPLPNLFKTGTVATTLATAYSSLPTDYMRDVIYVVDDGGDRIRPTSGGSYYDFMLFLNSITKKDLSETGSVYRVAMKGGNLYYQGIPSTSEDLTVMYYCAPTDLVDSTDEPSSIPSQFQVPLIKHYVCADIRGDILEGGEKLEYSYHWSRFLTAMNNLIRFIGIDAEPVYYSGGDNEYIDGAICD